MDDHIRDLFTRKAQSVFNDDFQLIEINRETVRQLQVVINPTCSILLDQVSTPDNSRSKQLGSAGFPLTGLSPLP
jgi:hypothetical protein